MYVIKATGLVPVKALVTIDNITPGKIFGMTPAAARAALKNKEVAEVDIPAGIEVEKVPGPEPEPVVEQKKVEDGPVEIPADWESTHKLSWIKLAEKITGSQIVLTDEQKQADVKSSDVAKGIIEEELKRRAAAEQPPADDEDENDPGDGAKDDAGGGENSPQS